MVCARCSTGKVPSDQSAISGPGAPMYNVSVQNSSQYTLEASDGATVPPNATWQTQAAIGNAWISSTQLGTLNFLDIGDQHIPGDSGETWGVLISYQGEEVVG